MPYADYERQKQQARDYYWTHQEFRETQPDRARNRRKQYRLTVLAHYGNKCAHCGYDKDLRALEIDHINNDGAQDRKKHDGRDLCRQLVLGKRNWDDYQVLCANCNRIKHKVYEEEMQSRVQ